MFEFLGIAVSSCAVSKLLHGPQAGIVLGGPLMHRSIRTLVFAFLMAGSMSAATILVDTFESGTTENWFVPGASPNPPTNQPTGGPAGAGDHYRQLVANGTPGAGGRLSALNGSQWALTYIAAGITAIRMDVNNQGP